MKTKSEKVFIIAEAGVNHNGSLETAMQLIDVAARAKCDAVKFQTYISEKVISKSAPKAEYQKATTGVEESQLEMVKKFEIDKKGHFQLLKYCQKKKIQFLSTPFDLESVDLLEEMNLDVWKIPSGEVTHLPYLRKIGRLNKTIFLSTGMCDIQDIRAAVDTLVASGTQRSKITILHCNTEYPTPFEDVNLRAMLTIQNELGLNVGYSDHTMGIEVSIAAVALGARVIEKHITLDRSMPGPDHKASLEPDELIAMVNAIRNVEQALGHGRKEISSSERKNIAIARKSIVANSFIKRGDKFSETNITAKRPGTGVSPMTWDSVIGKIAKRDFQSDELIEM